MTQLEAKVEIKRLFDLVEALQTKTKIALGEYFLEKTPDNLRNAELLAKELDLVTIELKDKIDAYEAKYRGK